MSDEPAAQATPRFRGEPPHNDGRSPTETSRGRAYVFVRRSRLPTRRSGPTWRSGVTRRSRGPRRRSGGSMNTLAHSRQRYALRMPVLSARTRPRARRSALRHWGQRRARVSVGPGATSTTRSLLIALIDPSVWVAPGGPGGRGAGRGVVTMPVGKGVEQGGPGPVIPAREAGDLIASDAESSILAARIHGPLHCEGILRARATQ
jgi:hypothetical protein